MCDSMLQALGCVVFPGGHRPDRTTGRGDGAFQTARLGRHAGISEDHSREGRRTRRQFILGRESLVGGGKLLLPLRQVCDARIISVLQGCGTADVGNIA
jgi:hypothetical protein